MTTNLFLSQSPQSGARARARIDIAESDPWDFHHTMPGYEATPLYDCPALARELGVGTVLVKDESVRLGLPSFKMLGASWATARAIQREWIREPGNPISLEGLREGISTRSGLGLAAATDGNHGRGVARMARLLDLSCRIFVPSGTAQSRIDAIASEGATVTVVDGTYDDAILRSAEEASEQTLIISDTSWEGYWETPTDVIRGYSTMFREIEQSLIGRGPIDVVSFQAGVGAFAAAGLSHFAVPERPHRPIMVIVEPESANCLMRSAQQGQIAEAPGPHESMMAGLNCGLPSMIAWPIVQACTDAYVAIDDDAAYYGMRLLAQLGIVAGESGAATVGAFLSLEKSQRDNLGLAAQSVLLFINTEGATDPVNYLAHVGLRPEEVIAARQSLQEKELVSSW
jgi:diaminopropionate ammonia-lyase